MQNLWKGIWLFTIYFWVSRIYGTIYLTVNSNKMKLMPMSLFQFAFSLHQLEYILLRELLTIKLTPESGDIFWKFYISEY